MSPPSIGNIPMTGAERQARYRAAHADGAPVIRFRRLADRCSRIQRWSDAIAALVDIQAEYARGPSIDWGIMNRAIRSVGYIAGWGLVDGMDATFGWDRG
jgi:hypothetical protein